ncbi:MAG: DNA repair protein RadC [Pseudomonadales bacterium]
MSILDWQASARPREKLLQHGCGSLSDSELLAIFLRTGTRGKSAVDLAWDILEQCGGLRNLFERTPSELELVAGLGPAKSAQLVAILEMARRYLSAELHQRPVLSSPKATREYLQLELSGRPHEVFCALFLDAQNRMLAFEELFNGTIDGAAVYPREVVRKVLQHNAAAVIFAHNHPSGVAEPSQADHRITERLQQALGLIDVRVLDHLVVGAGRSVSFAENGWL